MRRRQQAQATALAVASEVRQALKEAFPDTSFRVSHLGYADGRTHVPVYWPASGPEKTAVQAVCRPFESKADIWYQQDHPLTAELMDLKDEARRISRMSYEQVDALFDEAFAKMKAASGEEYNRLQGLVQVYNRRLRLLRRNETIKRFTQVHGRKPATNAELWAWHYEAEKVEAPSE